VFAQLPNLTIQRKDKCGINLTSTVANTHLDSDTAVKVICSEYRIHNANVTLRCDSTADGLIDIIEGSRVYMPCRYVVNTIDQITLNELEVRQTSTFLAIRCPTFDLRFDLCFSFLGRMFHFLP